MIEGFIMHILVLLGIYALLGVSLNLSIGYGGILSLAHVAFMGIGAYTYAILAPSIGFVAAIILAMLHTVIWAYVLGRTTTRLSGDYLALGTISFSLITYGVILNWSSMTGGAIGLPGVFRPEWLLNQWAFLAFNTVLCTIAILAMNWFVKSPYGLLVEATRDDEVRLRLLGRNTQTIKTVNLTLSAAFAALAGTLYAMYVSYIDPVAFHIAPLIVLITIVIVGGLASIKGTLVGTFIVITLPELMRFLPIPSHVMGPIQNMLYLAILLIILMYRPRGILGRVDLNENN